MTKATARKRKALTKTEILRAYDLVQRKYYEVDQRVYTKNMDNPDYIRDNFFCVALATAGAMGDISGPAENFLRDRIDAYFELSYKYVTTLRNYLDANPEICPSESLTARKQDFWRLFRLNLAAMRKPYEPRANLNKKLLPEG